MKTSSKLMAAALAAMTLAASAGSALAARHQYPNTRNGMRMGGYHHHSRMYQHHHRMMRHHYRHMMRHRMM